MKKECFRTPFLFIFIIPVAIHAACGARAAARAGALALLFVDDAAHGDQNEKRADN